MMGRKAAKSATVSEQCLALLKNSKTLAFKLVRLASPALFKFFQRRNAHVGCLIASHVASTPLRRHGLPQLLTLRSRRHC